mgnify:CR=1 FL=1
MQRKELIEYPIEDVTIICKLTDSLCEQHAVCDDRCLGTCIQCPYANCAIIVDNGVAYCFTLVTVTT